MKKAFLYLLLGFQFSIAQEIVFEKPSLINAYDYKEATIDFIDNGSTFNLNYISESTALSWLFSEDLKKITHKRAYKVSTTCINPLGSFGTEDTSIFIYTNNNKKKFRAVTIHHKNSNIEYTPLDFKLSKEKLINAFAYKQQFYLFTFSKKSLTYRFHIFDTHLNHSIKEIKIGTKNLKGSENLDQSKQEQWLNSITSLSYNSRAVLIEDNTSYQNSIITRPSKMFISGNKLSLTIDKKNYTNIVDIDLENYTAKIKRVGKIHLGVDYEFLAKSNSLLFKNLLFVVKGNSSQLNLRIFDNLTDSLMVEHNFDKNSSYTKERNLIVSEQLVQQYNLPKAEKSKDNIIKKRLRKIMKGDNEIGLRVSEVDNKYYLNFGGYLHRTGHAPVAGMGMGFPGFTMGIGFYYNFERDESLNLYLDSSNFDIGYTEDKPVYDKMNDFLNERYKGQVNSNTHGIKKFKYKDNYYLSYFDINNRTFYIRKFK
jgi:hypothetical protein